MIERLKIEFKTKAAAKRFAEALNEALDAEMADVAESGVDVVWTSEADPTELFEALGEARDQMDWEF